MRYFIATVLGILLLVGVMIFAGCVTVNVLPQNAKEAKGTSQTANNNQVTVNAERPTTVTPTTTATIPLK